MTKLDIMENVLSAEKCELTEDIANQQIHNKKVVVSEEFQIFCCLI